MRSRIRSLSTAHGVAPYAISVLRSCTAVLQFSTGGRSPVVQPRPVVYCGAFAAGTLAPTRTPARLAAYPRSVPPSA
eukprot:2495002-Rhodomonas_salina.1